MTTAELMKLLKAKFCPPSYATFTEVADSTGAVQRRWADAVAMSLWPSRGLLLAGFELKVSRSDWIKERDNPAKAKTVFRYCDRWYLVVSDAEIVRDGELPEPWGLLMANGKGLKQVKAAPALAPVPLDRKFAAALLRRASEQTADLTAIAEARAIGFAEGKKDATWRAEHDAKALAELRKACNEFEAASGISIVPGWGQLGRIGKIVYQLLHHDPTGAMESLATHARRVADECDKALAEFKGLKIEEKPRQTSLDESRAAAEHWPETPDGPMEP